MLLTSLLPLIPFLGTPSVASPIASRQDSSLPRLVIYYQTTHDSNGNPISMLPLVQEQGIALTHLIVCSFHINAGSELHLNDNAPSDSYFDTMWNETKVLQNAGIKIMGMIGGAAGGSFDTDTLDAPDDATFETYYAQLHSVITTYNLQGFDLDVEQSMSLSGVERLVSRLKSDFGSNFLVTLAPVASALDGASNLSGFSYDSLDAADGSDINFYNGQFYNGFGSLDSPSDYENIVSRGYSPSRVVAGQITTPDNGSGYVDFPTINQTVIALRDKYGQIGGIMGWEYFNSQPGGTSAPWEWAQQMTEILRPGQAATLEMTAEQAEKLEAAYKASQGPKQPNSIIKHAPKVDYRRMVNKQ